MLIAGFQKMTLLDYPDKLAALIFTQGCNFACGYCHNAEMIPLFKVLDNDPQLEPENILEFLSTRKGKLDGVVISGGEPTLQADLEEFITRIKEMGFLVKLDSNGSNPDILKRLINKNLLDYIAMDVKYSLEKYQDAVKTMPSDRILESIEIIKNSQVDYEFRTTIVPNLHFDSDIQSIGKMIEGSKRWYLQNFRPLKTLSSRLSDQRGFNTQELDEMKKLAEKYATVVEVRN